MKIRDIIYEDEEPSKKYTLTYYDKDGWRHRENGPAVIWPSGSEAWYNHSAMHSYNDQPSEIYKDSYSITKRWHRRGRPHRDNDKPAVVETDLDGNIIVQYWYFNGKAHRDDNKPAVVYTAGTKHWYVNGASHRLDGPSSIYSNGTREWEINGVPYGMTRDDAPPPHAWINAGGKLKVS